MLLGMITDVLHDTVLCLVHVVSYRYCSTILYTVQQLLLRQAGHKHEQKCLLGFVVRAFTHAHTHD